jgi:hypothetical protein
MRIKITPDLIDFQLAFDYPNLVVGNYIPFLWNLNTNIWNNEGRLWSYTKRDNFYIKLISQYTHKEYILYGNVDFTNNRYTQATFDLYSDDDEFDEIDNFWNEEQNEWDYKGENYMLEGADDGFYYTYFILEGESGEAVVIYENLTYLSLEGNKPTFISNISDNETRQIIYANI